MAAALPVLCSMKTRCDWLPLALGSAGGRGPAHPPPQPLPGRESLTQGAKYRQAEIWTQALFERVPAYLRAHRVNRRSSHTLPLQTWRHSSAGRAAAAVSLHSLSALFLLVLFYSAQVACRLQAGSHVLCICVEPQA